MEREWDETESLMPLVMRQEGDETLTNFPDFQYFGQDHGQDFRIDQQTDDSETESLEAFSLLTKTRRRISSFTGWFHSKFIVPPNLSKVDLSCDINLQYIYSANRQNM